MTSFPAHFIQDSQNLAPVITALMEAQFIALDTEFVRRNTYKPILCLVQAMTDKGGNNGSQVLWILNEMSG